MIEVGQGIFEVPEVNPRWLRCALGGYKVPEVCSIGPRCQGVGSCSG
jgi:hypothetical protein